MKGTNQAVKLLFSIAAVILLVMRSSIRNFLPSDGVTIGLLIAVILPWISSFIDTAEFPGGWKFKFRELKAEQVRQKAEIESLRFLISYFVTEFELTHLEKLESGEPFPYQKSESFITELRRLRSLAMITNYPNKDIRSMPQQGDLRDYFRVTERGTTYLQLRKHWEGDKETNKAQAQHQNPSGKS